MIDILSRKSHSGDLCIKLAQQHLGNNEENQEKVKTIVDKAHNQGKQVICEFIEDASTMSIMWKMSVNFVQGNFIAEPGENMEQVE